MRSSCKQQDLSKLIPHFDGTSDISVYLALFNRQNSKMNIVKENWIIYRLSLLPLEIFNIIDRGSEQANNYDYVKKINYFLSAFSSSLNF